MLHLYRCTVPHVSCVPIQSAASGMSDCSGSAADVRGCSPLVAGVAGRRAHAKTAV